MARDMDLEVGIKGFKRGTNIKDVKVPAPLRIRRKSGIDWFDAALGGEGYVPTSVMMLTGMPGAGKSTMIRQLADSLTGQGHPTLMNSGEESLYQVAMVCERLKLKHGFLAGQEILVPELLNYADNIRNDPRNKDKTMFLLQDSLQTINDGYYKDGGSTGNTPVRVSKMLVDWAKKNFAVVVFVGQCTKGGDFAGKNTIKHAIDIHGHLYFDDDRKSDTFGERLFECSKNRWGTSGRTFIIGMNNTGLFEKGSFQKGKDWSPEPA